MKKGFWSTAGVLVLLLVGGGVWFFLTIGEMGKPVIEAGPDTEAIGLRKDLAITFSDSGRGLGRAEIAVTQDNRTQVISVTDYPEAGVRRKSVTAVVDAAALKLHDGAAVLTLTAIDRSVWKNRTVLTIPATIDSLPPRIFQLNAQSHINPGGACVVAYSLSEAAPMTGVRVGDLFFPAFATTIGGKPGYAAYFALPMTATVGNPRLLIVARDRAGNEGASAIPALILKRKFRADKVNLPDQFFAEAMPEFQAMIPDLREKNPIETFTYVNTLLRADNLKTIQAACAITEPRPLWQDTFLRMKNAAPTALFGDRRIYVHADKPIGESVHDGVDLASTQHSPIEAANNGIVRFADALGIYGNAVIIDHGMGLATLYGHLSGIQVKVGQGVKRGEVIGISGRTGLAGGDHLHFGVAVHGRFVDPREWWDAHWIADNVTRKLNAGF